MIFKCADMLLQFPEINEHNRGDGNWLSFHECAKRASGMNLPSSSNCVPCLAVRCLHVASLPWPSPSPTNVVAGQFSSNKLMFARLFSEMQCQESTHDRVDAFLDSVRRFALHIILNKVWFCDLTYNMIDIWMMMWANIQYDWWSLFSVQKANFLWLCFLTYCLLFFWQSFCPCLELILTIWPAVWSWCHSNFE